MSALTSDIKEEVDVNQNYSKIIEFLYDPSSDKIIYQISFEGLSPTAILNLYELIREEAKKAIFK